MAGLRSGVVTEKQWLATREPYHLMYSLHRFVAERKLRLFACAYFRARWGHLVPQSILDVVTTSEDYADAPELKEQLRKAKRKVVIKPADPAEVKQAKHVAQMVTRLGDEWYAAQEMLNPKGGVARTGSPISPAASEAMIRCAFGNPYEPLRPDPKWLTDTVVGLAGGMYKSREFGAMPVLADALEEADCENAEVLAHCRGTVPHARGCWVADALLGKPVEFVEFPTDAVK
jgi:hypothetical protein